MSDELTDKDRENIREAMKRANPDIEGDLLRRMGEIDSSLPERFEKFKEKLTNRRR